MSNSRATEMVRKLTEDGSLLDHGPNLSRLLIRVMRTLAHGRPIPHEKVDAIIAELGIAQDEADEYLRKITERDASDTITGILGLSLNDTAHRLVVNGARLSAWCAADTLFLPALLDQTAIVESESPVSKAKVRLVVSPQRVEEVSPVSAVVSMVIVEPDEADMASVEGIWSTFCHHIYFFASREEAEQWIAGRDNIEILTVDQGFALGQMMSSRFLAYAR